MDSEINQGFQFWYFKRDTTEGPFPQKKEKGNHWATGSIFPSGPPVLTMGNSWQVKVASCSVVSLMVTPYITNLLINPQMIAWNLHLPKLQLHVGKLF